VSQTSSGWSDRHPNRDQLRAETRCLTACVRDVLLARVSEDEIRGIYLTGSTVKPWESPLDYVPEISDVDIHVSFHHDHAWRQYLDTVPRALEVQSGIEACFARRIPQPLHHPRLQLMVTNQLMLERPGFVYAPQSTAVVLHGEPYPTDDYSDPDSIRRHNAADLLERAEFVRRLPLLAIDRLGPHARDLLSQLVWRVSPVGPLALHLAGLGAEHAWSLNRTHVTAELRNLGLDTLADSYTAFYLSGWDCFLSGFADTNACRAAILAGTRALTEGAGIGWRWLNAKPSAASRDQ